MPLPVIHHGKVVPKPVEVRRVRLNRGVWELLVQWIHSSASEASWILLPAFCAQYLDFQLEDELFVREGGNVVECFVGKTYQRRRRTRDQAQAQNSVQTSV